LKGRITPAILVEAITVIAPPGYWPGLTSSSC
jgi:hypothetical protein